MELTTDTFNDIIETAEIERENEGAVLDVAYSGRYMYGAACPAIRVDSERDLRRFFVAAGMVAAARDEEASLATSRTEEAGVETFDPMWLADGVQTDSMGHGIVAYWPTLELT